MINQILDYFRLRKTNLIKTIIYALTIDMFLKTSELINYPKMVSYILQSFVLFLSLLEILPELLKKPLMSKNTLLFIFIFALCGVSTLLSHNSSLFFMLLICYVVKDFELEDIFIYLIKSSTIVLLIEFLYYLFLTYVANVQIPIYENNIGIRYTFGIGHPNTLSLYIFNMLLMWFISSKKSIKVKIIIYLIVITAAFLLTKSRTTFILGLFVLTLLVVANKDITKINNIIKTVSYFIFPLTCIVFFLFTYLYKASNPSALMLNEALSGRLYLTDIAIEKCGLSILGRYIKYSDVLNGGYFFIDSLYPYLLCEYGTIWIIILSFIIPYSINKDVYNAVLIIVFALYGVTEHVGMNPVYLCSLLVLKNAFKQRCVNE